MGRFPPTLIFSRLPLGPVFPSQLTPPQHFTQLLSPHNMGGCVSTVGTFVCSLVCFRPGPDGQDLSGPAGPLVKHGVSPAVVAQKANPLPVGQQPAVQQPVQPPDGPGLEDNERDAPENTAPNNLDGSGDENAGGSGNGNPASSVTGAGSSSPHSLGLNTNQPAPNRNTRRQPSTGDLRAQSRQWNSQPFTPDDQRLAIEYVHGTLAAHGDKNQIELAALPGRSSSSQSESSSASESPFTHYYPPTPPQATSNNILREEA